MVAVRRLEVVPEQIEDVLFARKIDRQEVIFEGVQRVMNNEDTLVQGLGCELNNLQALQIHSGSRRDLRSIMAAKG